MDVIQEFIIGIGYKVDSAGLDQAEKQGEAAAKSVSRAWKTELAQVGRALKGLATGFATVAAGMFAFVERTTAAADATAKMARATGQSAEVFQRLRFAAEHGGASIEQLSAGYRFFNKQLQDTARGGGQALTAALERLGVSVSDLQGRDAETQLGILGDALNGISDEAERVALLSAVLGEEAGPKLASTLEGGSAGLKAMGDEAARLGVVLSDDALASAEAFQDQLTDTKAEVAGFAQAMAMDLLPIVRQVVEGIMAVVRWFGESESAAVRATPAIAALGVAVYAMAGPWGLAALGMAAFVAALPAMQDAVTDAIGTISGLNAEIERLNGLSGGQTKIRGSLGLIEGEAMKAERQSVAERQVRDKMAVLSDDDLATLAARGRGRAKTLAQSEINERGSQAQWLAEQKQREDADLDRALAARGDALVRDKEKAGKKKSGGGARPDDLVFDDDYDTQAQEQFGADIDRLAERSGATEQARQNAMTAAAASLRSGNSAKVAKQAAIGTLSSATGMDFAPSNDRILSEILGDDMQPDVRLAEITRDTTPQVLTSNITNNVTNTFEIVVEGAGEPGAVADNVVDRFEDLWTNKVQQTSTMVKVLFDR